MTFDKASLIQKLELSALKARPPLHKEEVSGWILTTSRGYTKRSNAAYPLTYTGTRLAADIDQIEARYQSFREPSIFKLTEAAQPKELDEVLEEKGYKRVDESSVQELVLSQFLPSQDYSFAHSITADSFAKWFPGYCRLVDISPEDAEVLRTMLLKGEGHTVYASVTQEDQLIGSGMGVQEGERFWIFAVFIAPEFRGQHAGKELVMHLLEAGRDIGCLSACIQVSKTNTQAVKLY